MLTVFILVLFMVPADLFEPTNLPFALEVYRMVALAVLTLWVMALLLDPRTRLRGTPLDPALAFLLLAIVLSLSINLSDAKPVFSVLGLILMFYFIVSTFRSPQEIEAVLRFIVGVAAVVSVFGIVERLTGYNFFLHLHEWLPFLPQESTKILMRNGLRVAGAFGHPISFSAVLTMVVPFAWHFYLVGRGKTARFLYGGAAASMILAIVFTGSRTGVLGLAAVAIVLWLASPAHRKTMVFSLLIAVALIQMAFPDAIEALYSSLSPSYLRSSEIGNENGRFEDYPRIWRQLQKKPLVGEGYGSFAPGENYFIDNQYLGFVVEIGLLGLAAVLYLFYRLLVLLIRSIIVAEPARRGILAAATAAAVSFIVGCATFDTFGFMQVPYLFFTISALGVALTLTPEPTESNGGLSLENIPTV